MSITLYSGTPGSGKSYHAVKYIVQLLKYGKNVIANFPMDLRTVKGIKGKFYFIPEDNDTLSDLQKDAFKKESKKKGYIYLREGRLDVPYLCKFALKRHIKGKEAQTFLFLDEASRMFNPRDFGRADRMPWNTFMSLHRHLGYSIILISQHDRLLDRQIRYQIEYEVKHRSITNYRTIGRILGFMGLKIFTAVHCWYAVKGQKDYTEVIKLKKKIACLYDSYALFNIDLVNDLADGGAHRRGSGGPAEHVTDRKGLSVTNDDNAELTKQRMALISVLSEVVTQKAVAASRSAPAECVTSDVLTVRNNDHVRIITRLWSELTRPRHLKVKN